MILWGWKRDRTTMGRPPVIPAEKKLRIVLSVLSDEMTIAEATRRERNSEQSIGRWKAEFLEVGKQGLIARKLHTEEPADAPRTLKPHHYRGRPSQRAVPWQDAPTPA